VLEKEKGNGGEERLLERDLKEEGGQVTNCKNVFLIGPRGNKGNSG